ncbi:MAG: hypothetical protein ACOCZ6_05450 [Nanoarchaeota archaeon]
MVEKHLKFVSEIEDDLGKVVQLYVDYTPVLAVGNLNTYHEHILENVLLELGASPVKEKLSSGRYRVKKDGPLYQAVGMGVADFFPWEEKRIYLSRESLVYDMEIDLQHAKDLNECLDEYKVIPEKVHNYV